MTDDKFNIMDMLQLTSTCCQLAGHNLLKKTVELDITTEQFGIVFLLYYEDGLYQSQVAKHLKKDRPNITRMVDILEKKGYITRKKDEENKKIVKLFITDYGKKAVHKIEPLRAAFYKNMMDGFSENDIKVLNELLAKIRQNMSTHYGINIWQQKREM